MTLEGLDGSGKTTQSRLLRAFLDDAGHPAFFTREPGGTELGERLRAITLPTRAGSVEPIAEALLMSAARAQLVAQEIRPRLARGEPVVCDRFYDSTLAYQGYGRGLSLDGLRNVTRFAVGGLTPDTTILLDISIEDAARRKEAERRHGAQEPSQGPANFFDVIDMEFRQRVRQGYQEMAAQEPDRWLVIDAAKPERVVHAQIRAAVSQLWGREGHTCRT
ncbi:MAG: dTMP kinase [Dehalococcoidia bacterium]